MLASQSMLASASPAAEHACDAFAVDVGSFDLGPCRAPQNTAPRSSLALEGSFLVFVVVVVGCAAEKPSPTKAPAAGVSTNVAPASPPSTSPVTSASPNEIAGATSTPKSQPRLSDDCTGDELQAGSCKCANVTCFDTCCRKNEACAHHSSPDQGWSKCVHH